MLDKEQSQAFMRLYNAYNAERVRLSDEKKIFEKAIENLKKRKRQTMVVKAEVMAFEGERDNRELIIKRIQISLDSLGRIQSNPANAVAEIFLKKCFKLFADLDETEEKDYFALYSLHQNLDRTMDALAEAGYPIYYSYRMYKSFKDEEEGAAK